MEIRSLFEDPGAYEEVRKLLNLFLHRDFVDRRTFQTLTFKDPNFDPKFAIICIKSGKVVAAAIGVRRVKEPASLVEHQHSLAWMKAVACERGEEDKLKEVIAELENKFAAEGRKQVRVSDYASWYLSPGVDLEYENILTLLEEMGYSKVGEAVNYEIDMARFMLPMRLEKLCERLRQNGIVVRKARLEESELLSRWVEERFSPFWRIEVEMGMNAEDGGVLLAEKDGEIIGFSVYGALRPDYFGPIGVDPQRRGGGVGTVLLFECLKLMKAEGVRVATIPWTTHLTFYTQIPGLSSVRTFSVMGKNLV
ncbi:MAG: GNAT family N-acetyltransferase [Thermofilaceae archaeon]|nr:GNAT family N-acetyltransferase [Thermofilaceae archaeon]